METATIAEIDTVTDDSLQRNNLLNQYLKKPPFSPKKTRGNLRTDAYKQPSPFVDALCAGTPPDPVPEPAGSLALFIEDLLNADAASLKDGSFSFTVPEDVYNDYHYLNEYRAKNVRDAFCFGWGNYRKYAWGADEIHPIDATPGNNWGGIGMTLLDGVDTLKILGLEKEFEEATRWIQTNATFDKNIQAPVFEYNIRIVGGLLAAYDLSKNRMFLEKACEIADRLLPAFSTPSGYPTVATLRTDSLDLRQPENGRRVNGFVDAEQRHSGGAGNDVCGVFVLLQHTDDM